MTPTQPDSTEHDSASPDLPCAHAPSPPIPSDGALSRAQDETTTQPPRAPGLVLDACVMMSGLLRPLMLNLGHAGVLIPIWTDKIGDEWQRNAARLWPIEPTLLAEEWQSMQEQFPLANMGDVTEFEGELRHTDRKDKHVAAAGIAAIAHAVSGPVSVLTWNIKDFSRSELRKQGLGLSDPDRLLSLWWPTHKEVLSAHIERTLNDLFASGRRQPEAVVTMLKRDRLFRLAGCYERHQDANPT